MQINLEKIHPATISLLDPGNVAPLDGWAMRAKPRMIGRWPGGIFVVGFWVWVLGIWTPFRPELFGVWAQFIGFRIRCSWFVYLLDDVLMIYIYTLKFSYSEESMIISGTVVCIMGICIFLSDIICLYAHTNVYTCNYAYMNIDIER